MTQSNLTISTMQVLRAFEANLKKSSIITIRYALDRAARELGIYNSEPELVRWHQVDALALQEVIVRWSGEMAGATLNLHLCALRGIFRSCLAHGLITHQAYLALTQIESIAIIKNFSCGIYVDQQNIRMLMESCDNDQRRTLAARDQALISILFGTVIGRMQAVNLQIGDLDLTQGMICVSSESCHLGGRKLEEWAITPLREWLCVLAGQGQSSGRVLRRISNGGRALSNMQAGGLYIALRNRCVTAGVNILKPRDARRTVATNLINSEGRSLTKITIGSNSLTATLRFTR